MKSTTFTTLLLLICSSVFAQNLQIEGSATFESDVQIGTSNGLTFSSQPTLNIFGDNAPSNFILRLEQGGEGTNKGVFFGSPSSNSSARLFLDNNIFSIGRANSTDNLSMLNFNVNGNIGISEVSPTSKLHVNGDVQIGESNGAAFSSKPTLNIFGDSNPSNFILRLEQGGEGTNKGVFFGSPSSNSSARLFLDNDIFSIGRANSTDNLSMLNFNVNGNIGINEVNPKAKLHVNNGDVYIEEIGSGLIMKSPNGQCWRYTPDNTGQLISTSVGCPENGAGITGKTQKITLTQPSEELNLNQQQPTSELIQLKQNVPNPFNGVTRIQYNLSTDIRDARIKVYHASGKLIKDAKIEGRGSGEIELQMDANTKGVYFYSLEVDGQIIDTKQMSSMK